MLSIRTYTLAFFSAGVLFAVSSQPVLAVTKPWWEFQAIDTMKYSRDLSYELLKDPVRLKKITDAQVMAIAETGATHVAIATPYDEEFLPVLQEWVAAARRYHLHVWFRGNWSGWEEWFDHSRITREEHLKKTIAFIKQNPGLFENGDFFSACPECENGGPGDPRLNGDVTGHREFLIKENQEMAKAFREINKNIQVNLNSMNGDVVNLVMDPTSTQALGGQVVVDHYVSTPAKLDESVTNFAKKSGGRVILGEFGAPIPDINGRMTEQQQADWIDKSMALLAKNNALYGLSYWTNMGGSTALWHEDGTPKPAVAVIKKWFTPSILSGKITNQLGETIKAAKIHTDEKDVAVAGDGSFDIPYLTTDEVVTVNALKYTSQEFTVAQIKANPQIILSPSRPGLWYRFRLWWNLMFNKS